MDENQKAKAYTLAPDEKTTLVMAYTPNSLVRGEVVTKQSIRVSIWLRTQGAPEYLRLLKPNILIFGGAGPVKSLNFTEFFVPTQHVIAFHISPPSQEPLDYDETEANRIMEPVSALVGTFIFEGHMRISSQADMGTNLEVMRTQLLSLYNVNVSNPYLPGMGVLHVPMLLVRPAYVSFGLST